MVQLIISFSYILRVKAKENSLTDNYKVILRRVDFVCLLLWCGK